VPWARHDSAFTAAFEEQTAWLSRTRPRSRWRC
jgi:hypothetical protein